MLIYVALSWAVRFDMRDGEQIASLVYPLDTFSMYAGLPGHRMGHLLVRDEQGTIHRVTAFRSFDCAEPVSHTAQCPDRPGYSYHFDDFIRYIEDHRGAGAIDAELIYRTWQIPSGHAPEHEADCIIAHCKVSR